MSNFPRCPSCGVAFEDHLGLIGTCRRLQESSASDAALRRIAEAMPAVIDGRASASDDSRLIASFYRIIRDADPPQSLQESAILARMRFMRKVLGGME